jgi:hypothetical protein
MTPASRTGPARRAAAGQAPDMSQQPAEPAAAVPVPQVVASYAAYLHASAHAEPQVTVTGGRAEVSVTARGSTLVLAFGVRQRAWALDAAELRCGEQARRFGRRELARAVAALLSHAPAAISRKEAGPE